MVQKSSELVRAGSFFLRCTSFLKYLKDNVETIDDNVCQASLNKMICSVISFLVGSTTRAVRFV